MLFFEDYSALVVLDKCESLRRQHAFGQQEILYEMDELMQMAVQQRPDESVVYSICRLLYESRTDQRLRGPYTGVHQYLGGTTELDWPLDPIHLFEGVPFAVVSGYRSITGPQESAASYLGYCLTNGIWRTQSTEIPKAEDMIQIANRFVVEGPWKRPLRGDEREWILSQIET